MIPPCKKSVTYIKRLLTYSIILFFIKNNFAFAKQLIRIGYIGGLTGRNSLQSQRSLMALQLAVSEYNKINMNRGYQVEILPFDNQSSAAKNFDLILRAKKSGVVGITGVHISNDAIILSEKAEQEHLPLIVASATNPEISANRKYVVQVCFTDKKQGQLLFKFAYKNLSALKIAIVTDIDDHASMRVSESFKKSARAFKDVQIEEFPIKTGQHNFDKIVEQIQNMNRFDLFFVSSSALESAYFIHALSRKGIKPKFLGTDNWQNQDLIQILQSLNENSVVAMFPAHWHEGLNDYQSKKLKHDFFSVYGIKLNSFDADPALTYDAGKLLLAAIDNARSLKPEQLIKKLKSNIYIGATGKIQFTNTGETEKDIFILKLKNNIISQIGVLK